MRVIYFMLLIVTADGALYEGDLCDRDGEIGICTRIHKCPTAPQELSVKRKLNNCGYSGAEPIVCCITPSNSTSETTRYDHVDMRSQTYTTENIPPEVIYEDLTEDGSDSCPPITLQLTSQKTGQKAWDKCIEYQEKLVIPCVNSSALLGGYTRKNLCRHNADELVKGGTAAEPYEFPHMALLGFGNDMKSIQWLNGGSICGGSLISEKFVLTAAHCISTEKRIPATHVVLGVLNRSQIGSQSWYKIKKIYQHPKYNPNFSYNDIALLELEDTVPLSEYLVPACLHTRSLVDDSLASATGWGNTKHDVRGGSSDVLLKVVLSKFDVEQCAVKYDQHTRKLPKGLDPYTQVCYGDIFGKKDTCQGDSGGPLQIKNKEITCMYTVIGVTSLGKPCVYADTEPGIYTRVYQYLDWIESIVWP